MKYLVKNIRWLINNEGEALPFAISKKGDKIKDITTGQIIKLKQTIESDIVDQMNAGDYKIFNQVFSAKTSTALTNTLGFNTKVLHTEVVISNSFTGIKNQDPWVIYDSKVDEKELSNITKRINIVKQRYAKSELAK